MNDKIEVTLAGLTFPCALRYPETAGYFPTPDPAAPRAAIAPVRLYEEDWAFLSGPDAELCPHTEFSFLTFAFSEALLDFDRMILHAVALRWRDRAFLICGKSGVGKSTQTRFLQELRPGEFGIICGDRPILQFRHSEPCRDGTLPSAASPVPPRHSERSEAESKNPSSFVQSLPLGGKVSPQATDEGSIIVHPSPWNGKENWHGAEAAPLAGMILLQRGETNKLKTMTPKEAAFSSYSQVIQFCKEAEKVHKSAELFTRLLRSVPVWELTSCQVPDSTRLLLESVFPAPE